MIAYVKGFLALFVLLTVLLHLLPGNGYQKYIHFFAEFIMTLAILTPILSILGDSDEFLKLVEYEAFTEELASVSKDMQHMEYLYGDYHREAYEEAIAEDVKRIAEGYAFCVKEVSVTLSEEYTVNNISLWVTENANEEIAISRVTLGEEKESADEDIICAELKQELMEFYQLDESKIKIQYGDG